MPSRRRASTGERLPVPALVLADHRHRLLRPAVHRAAVAHAVEHAVGRPRRRRRCATALWLSIECSLWATALVDRCSACRWRGCWPGVELPRAWRRARPVHVVDGAAAGRRRRRPVLLVRPPRPVRAVPRTTGSASACRSRPGAWSSPRRSSPCRSSCSPWRPRCASSTGAIEDAARTLGGVALVRVPPGHAAGDPPGADRRRGAGLGPGARRVRRHDHVRRQLPGHHADDAAGDRTWRWSPNPDEALSSAWC